MEATGGSALFVDGRERLRYVVDELIYRDIPFMLQTHDTWHNESWELNVNLADVVAVETILKEAEEKRHYSPPDPVE